MDGFAGGIGIGELAIFIEILGVFGGENQIVAIDGFDDLALIVEKIAVAIFLIDGPEDPAMAVKVGEASVLEVRVVVHVVERLEEVRSGGFAELVLLVLEFGFLVGRGGE